MTIVAFTRTTIVMDRRDPPNRWFPQGLGFRYQGKVAADGSRVSEGTQINTFGGLGGSLRFRATWGAALNDLPGQDPPRGAPALNPAWAGMLVGLAILVALAPDGAPRGKSEATEEEERRRELNRYSHEQYEREKALRERKERDEAEFRRQSSPW